MHLMHLRKKIMHPIRHKLNMNHTVVMSNCFCYNQHTAQKQLRNWNLFSSKRLATKASTSHSLKDVQDICFESVLTLQIQKKNIKAKSSISLRKKNIVQNISFLILYQSPRFFLFSPMSISRNFFYLHRFSLLYFSMVFDSLYNKKAIFKNQFFS